jgi:hypothetical protein
MAVQYAFGKIVTQGLDLNVDAADPTSYPGSGTSWTSVVNRSITGSLVSCSYSTDFKGGIVFNNPSASVIFPGTVANYGSGSFTVEMAFRPTQIQGIHYLVSKNSGSFPNWGVYLSGSGGQGKLFAEYRINASVSCSVSSSTTFVTGSNYFVDTVFAPMSKTVYINVEGNYDAISVLSNGTGSLGTTDSLFVGNLTTNSPQAYSGSIFNTKIYSTFTSGYNNYRTITQRIQKLPPVRPTKALALIVGGGGGGGSGQGPGGGGAGGFVVTSPNLTPGITYSVSVGDGGLADINGQSSSLDNTIAYGGGAGGTYSGNVGKNGASGGGAGTRNGGTFTSGGLAIYGSQGTAGGSSRDFNFPDFAVGGGGGGAGTEGVSGFGSTNKGNGGAGLLFINNTYYAGGGAGSAYGNLTGGFGGIGGGGNFNFTGSRNTGGGGGSNGKGGSGIVIIRYPGPPIATGGTITQVDGDTIHTFTATGSHTFTVF